MKIVTLANFEEEVLKSDKPVAVGFYANNCRASRKFQPTLNQAAEERADELKVVQVNFNASPDIAEACSVLFKPTVLMFKDGKVIARWLGNLPKEMFTSWIDKALTNPSSDPVAQEEKKLSEEDKKILREAYDYAVDACPEADMPRTGIVEDGEKEKVVVMTLRTAVKQDIDSGALFDNVETLLKLSGSSAEEYAETIRERGLKSAHNIGYTLGERKKIAVRPAFDRTGLSKEEKKKLRDAFEAAVNANPLADQPTAEATQDGSVTTLREMVNKDLDNGSAFSKAKNTMDKEGLSIDTLADAIKKRGLRLVAGKGYNLGPS
jgi:thioredoxin 1